MESMKINCKINYRFKCLYLSFSIQLIGAGLLTHARMVAAADRKMPPSHVTVWVAGQVVIVTSQECPVKLQPDREVYRNGCEFF